MQLPQLCLRRIASCYGRIASRKGATSRPDIRASRFPSTRPRINAEVWSIIQKMLLDGTLAAYIQANSGQIEALSPETWTEETHVDVTERKRVTGDVLDNQVSGRCFYQEGRLQLCCVWPRRLRAKGAATLKTRGDDRRGTTARPFSIEAFRLLFDRKLNSRMPADLWRGALDAYVEAGHPGGVPSEDWARKKIKRLWFAPGIGDKY